ncbi:MAG: HXXEE domain-containing protein [Vicinamibacterales bacterium]
MTDEIRSVLLGTLGLDAALLAAGWLAVARRPRWAPAEAWRAVGVGAALALACQALHFGEELATGFHRRLPELLGLTSWSPALFVGFNLAWIGVWAASARAVTSGRRGPLLLFPLWFLGLASAVNGLAHPALSLRVGGYFPGLATSPLVGVAGVALLWRLARATGDSPRKDRNHPAGHNG